MAELLEWQEDAPENFDHGLPESLSEKAMQIAPFAIWSRIEGWTGYRWAIRNFEALVEGPGDWHPPVGPYDIQSQEYFLDGWQSLPLVAAPIGIELGHAKWRIKGTVGSNMMATLDVLEAYRRLAEYLAEIGNDFDKTSVTYDVGSLKYSYRRDRNALSNALGNCAAADLLRPYRRLK